MRGESLVSPQASEASSPATMFANAEVRAAIKGALSAHYVPWGEVEDLTQEVLLRAVSLAEPPATLAECIALARKMATDLAIDRIRSARIRGRYNVGPCEDPDERP